jgi:hypothetical protein
MTSYSVRRLSILSLSLVVIALIGCNKTVTPPPTTAATPVANVDLPNVQVTSAHLERDGIMNPAKYWVFVFLNNSGPGLRSGESKLLLDLYKFNSRRS